MNVKKIIDSAQKFVQSSMEPMGNDTDKKTDEKATNIETDASGKKVTIYALSTCPWCKKTRKFFTEKGATIDYIEYDKADEETRKHIEEDCRSFMDELGFPVVKIDEEAVVGYNTKKYSDLLNK